MVRLLETVKARDASGLMAIVRSAPEMLRDGLLFGEKDLVRLEGRIKTIFASGAPMVDAIRETVEAFSEAGLPLNSFYTLRMFKGLLVLQAECYVDGDQFTKMFEEEAASYIKREHLVTYATDRAKSFFNKFRPASRPAAHALTRAVRSCSALLTR